MAVSQFTYDDRPPMAWRLVATMLADCRGSAPAGGNVSLKSLPLRVCWATFLPQRPYPSQAQTRVIAVALAAANSASWIQSTRSWPIREARSPLAAGGARGRSGWHRPPTTHSRDPWRSHSGEDGSQTFCMNLQPRFNQSMNRRHAGQMEPRLLRGQRLGREDRAADSLKIGSPWRGWAKASGRRRSTSRHLSAPKRRSISASGFARGLKVPRRVFPSRTGVLRLRHAKQTHSNSGRTRIARYSYHSCRHRSARLGGKPVKVGRTIG
jgi:hypothetical protein